MKALLTGGQSEVRRQATPPTKLEATHADPPETPPPDPFPPFPLSGHETEVRARVGLPLRVRCPSRRFQ